MAAIGKDQCKENYKNVRSGRAGLGGSPSQLLKAASSVANSGSKTESMILNRGDLETWNQ